MGSFYAIASRFAGPGIGNTAAHAAIGLYQANRLKRLVALGHNPTVIDDARIVDVRFPPRRLLWFWNDKRYYHAKNQHFDKVCLKHVNGVHNIVHLWNSQATATARRAKHQDKVLVIERASTHIVTQTQILTEAYARHGIDYQPTYAKTIRLCLEEYELADVILTPSETSYRSFADQGFDMRKIIRCPFGARLGDFAPRERAPKKFRAVFIGQVGIRKGVLTLLEAWDKAGIDGELLLIGGEEEVIGKKLAPWRKRDDIKFLGFRNDVAQLMKDASVFVFPSLEEGSALVTYEAMACSLPLIVTAEAGSVARDGREALVVPTENADSLAAAMIKLAEDPARAWDMGMAARRRVERFPWSAYGKRIARIHRMLSGGHDTTTIQKSIDID